jgi:histidinol dehydrogenase
MMNRFDASTWSASQPSRRGLDLSRFEKERAVVVEICARIAAEGDSALREYSTKFDGWTLRSEEKFEVASSELAAAAGRVDKRDREALEFAAKRIRDFHSRQVEASKTDPSGVDLISRSVRRAGLYAPGGRAAYPSTVLMTAIPARVAGVGQVVLATPPHSDGTVPDSILAAAHIAGVDTVYRMGGAQAIAAMAYGTESIKRVDVIAGPGNIYVNLAKREVFGTVGVDGIAGPTEVMVIADASARPDFIAADLAAQLEHDPMAMAVLVTDSAALADRVEEELDNLLLGLERVDIIRAATCNAIVVRDLDEAMKIANDYAPEHLLIVTDDAAARARQVENAGAVFVGAYATVPLGDYTAGPNHTLPTSGAARFASPLGVRTFMKQMSVLSLDRADLDSLQEATVRLAQMEGLGAHAHAVEVRLE